jgi:hypothetical protein
MVRESGAARAALNLTLTRGTTSMTRSVALVNFSGPVAIHTKVSTRTTSATGMARCTGQMGRATRGSGLGVSNTVTAA